MWWVPLAAAGLGAAGSWIAGNQQADAVRDANAATNEANADAQRRNEQLQREFAQQGIRWRVEDAKAAGIHPLAALGAQTHSFAPTLVGSTNMVPEAGSGWRAMGQMGQDISRAVSSMETREERELKQLQTAMAHTQLEGAAIDNQVKLAQLKKLVDPASGPAMPSGADTDNFIPGQGNSPLVRNKPLERIYSAPGRPAQEAGWRPDVSYSRTDTGLSPMVPESLSESMEDDHLGKFLWRVRNQLLPNFGKSQAPPKHMLPKGADSWTWSPTRQEWQPRYDTPMEKYMDKFRANLRKQYPGSRVR